MIRPLLVLAAALLCACRPDMTEQSKYNAYAPSPLWADGASARPLVAGTVARGALAWDEAVRTPPTVTPALVARGRERFEIFCSPCHGFDGTGDGRVVQRGFPQPPSYHSERLRDAPAEHFFDVITNGYGVMYPYGDRVPPTDRWAIITYIRALQLAGPATASLHSETAP